jgi:uncharacterized protein YchJ
MDRPDHRVDAGRRRDRQCRDGDIHRALPAERRIFTRSEKSLFRRIAGAWRYVKGDVAIRAREPASTPVGRNDPCPCGSGRKYKKCHGAG